MLVNNFFYAQYLKINTKHGRYHAKLETICYRDKRLTLSLLKDGKSLAE